MRVKVSASTATVIAEGPGSILIQNVTATHAVFLETGTAAPGEAAAAKPLATTAAGYELKSAAGPTVISLANGAILTGIAETAEQELHVLRDGPK